MKVIENKNFPKERDLYGVENVLIKNCSFDGEEDGESALKEARDVKLESCYMNLRYPLWHDNGVMLDNVTMTDKCRAALWYTEGVEIKNSHLLGIKALRECKDVKISNSRIVSPEFGWKSSDIKVEESGISSEYVFLMATDIYMDNVDFKGKYSFQYVKNALIENSALDTKDAFWHSCNVTVKNSVVKGEYLIDCEMENTDFSFEYSDVDATVRGDIVSVKNPRSGKIVADSIGEIIYTDDSKYDCEAEIAIR